MVFEFFFIIFLILINGLFAMTEMSLSTAKKARLGFDSENGSRRAKVALKLINEPNRYLSTIQIGITLIGILTGVFSGNKLAVNINKIIEKNPYFQQYSETISIILVVSIITYLSLILGEIVPKRIALANPEKIAKLFSESMNIISLVARPAIWLLSVSTDFVLKLFRVKQPEENVTEAELKELINRATKTGTIEIAEKEIVERTFSLSDKKISEIMIKKSDVIWLDINQPVIQNEINILNNIHRMYPVCNGRLENVLGVIHIKELLLALLKKENELRLEKMLNPVIHVFQGEDAYHIFNKFKEKKASIAIVTDSKNEVQGLITMDDLVDELVGEFRIIESYEDYITKRQDDSWFIDASIPVRQLAHYLKIPEETFGELVLGNLASFVANNLNYQPDIGKKFERNGYTFEIADMDGEKIDMILLEKL